MTVTLRLNDTPSAQDLAAIGDGLTAFNTADVGPAERLPLAITLTDDTGTILGGLSGYTAWGWLYIQWLFVSEPLRGEGWAKRLLAAAETEAKARSCHGAYIDTFNPVALKVYEAAGYTPFGTLPDFPKGRTRTFLQKPL